LAVCGSIPCSTYRQIKLSFLLRFPTPFPFSVIRFSPSCFQTSVHIFFDVCGRTLLQSSSLENLDSCFTPWGPLLSQFSSAPHRTRVHPQFFLFLSKYRNAGSPLIRRERIPFTPPSQSEFTSWRSFPTFGPPPTPPGLPPPLVNQFRKTARRRPSLSWDTHPR